MWDLRAEIADEDEGQRERWLAKIADDWRTAELDTADRALCGYAEKLTHRPSEMTQADVATLRAAGLDDVSIHDAIQVVSYFNYINRIADAVHVDLEPEMPPYPSDPR